jgi:hypothetical protein
LLFSKEKQERAEKRAGASSATGVRLHASRARLTNRATKLQPTATQHEKSQQKRQANNDKRRHKNLTIEFFLAFMVVRPRITATSTPASVASIIFHHPFTLTPLLLSIMDTRCDCFERFWISGALSNRFREMDFDRF